MFVNDTIALKTQKTGAKISIRLNQALNLDLEGLRLFEQEIKQSSRRITKDLNEALMLAHIKAKHISFHYFIHTFAIHS